MDHEKLARLKAGAAEEGKQYLAIFLYLWVLLTLFSLHRAFIFNEDLLTYHQGLALLNAFALAKVVLLGQHFKLGGSRPDAPVAAPALIKSAIFGLLLIVFHLVEETLIGVWRGKTVAESVPTIGDGSLQAILISAILVFVSLIPFFAFVELERVLGAQDLHTLLWGRRRPKGASGEHVERHFLNTETVRDVVIGMADGLTVPFALAAGITAAIASSRVVVTAGLAEIVAGATAMGLGGYLAARSDQEHFHSEEKREYAEVEKLPEQERNELREIFSQYGLQKPELELGRHRCLRRQDALGGFHDALRTGTRTPRPETRPHQRHDHRRGLCRRRDDPARALHDGRRRETGVVPFGAFHRFRSSRLRRGEGPADGGQPAESRGADLPCRRIGGGSGLLSGVAFWVTAPAVPVLLLPSLKTAGGRAVARPYEAIMEAA